jgi:hypothetical protein
LVNTPSYRVVFSCITLSFVINIEVEIIGFASSGIDKSYRDSSITGAAGTTIIGAAAENQGSQSYDHYCHKQSVRKIVFCFHKYILQA